MKNAVFAFLGCSLMLLGLFSCKKEELGRGFEMPYVAEFNIPPGINAFDTHYFYIDNLSSRYVSLLDQQGLTDAQITSINTQQTGLYGIFGDEDLSFISEASLRVFDERAPNDWVEIAYRQPTPLEPGSRLDLIPSLVDAKKYFSETRFNLVVVLRLRKTTSMEVPVRLNLIMRAGY
ncbi:MAG: hypothetical protein ACOYNO_01360 [Saprospiraceae bacterium]